MTPASERNVGDRDDEPGSGSAIVVVTESAPRSSMNEAIA
jgi:hypothetical protein